MSGAARRSSDNERHEGEDGAPTPLHQQTRQPRQPGGKPDGGWAARVGYLGRALLDVRKEKPPKMTAAGHLDQARFTAGVVRFYEAVVKEPVPEKMLSLIGEIAKRERKS